MKTFKSVQEFEEWAVSFAHKYLDKPVDPDLFAGTQCVDMPKQFCMDLGVTGNISTGGSGDALGYWKDTTEDLREQFHKVPIQEIGNIRAGDIVVWRDKATINGRRYGHVAVCFAVGDDWFTVIEQDGSKKWDGKEAHGVAYFHTYHEAEKVVGMLRYKNVQEDVIDIKPSPQPPIPKEKSDYPPTPLNIPLEYDPDDVAFPKDMGKTRQAIKPGVRVPISKKRRTQGLTTLLGTGGAGGVLAVIDRVPALTEHIHITDTTVAIFGLAALFAVMLGWVSFDAIETIIGVDIDGDGDVGIE